MLPYYLITRHWWLLTVILLLVSFSTLEFSILLQLAIFRTCLWMKKRNYKKIEKRLLDLSLSVDNVRVRVFLKTNIYLHYLSWQMEKPLILSVRKPYFGCFSRTIWVCCPSFIVGGNWSPRTPKACSIKQCYCVFPWPEAVSLEIHKERDTHSFYSGFFICPTPTRAHPSQGLRDLVMRSLVHCWRKLIPKDTESLLYPTVL